MLEGVLISISTDIIPNVVNPKAHASAQMMQSIIQGVRQLLPVYDQYLAEEHNQMMELLRDLAAQLDGTDSGRSRPDPRAGSDARRRRRAADPARPRRGDGGAP